MKVYQKVIYGIACVSLLIGGILTGFWKQLFDTALEKELELENTTKSESYAVWSSDTVPVYFSIRMFNWTNPELSLSKKDKPRFTERGPYVFKVSQKKDHVIWNDNDTVSFRNRRRWDFVPELSNGSLSDNITSLNVVAVTFAHFCKNNEIYKPTSNKIVKNKVKSLHVTKSVKELLFDGYDDEMLKMSESFKDVFEEFDRFPDKFAWYWGKNLSQSEMFNMYTGKTDINKLGMVYMWNESTTVKAYSGECDQVYGSPGELWPMNIAQQKEAPLFMSDLCGTFRLQNAGPKSVFGVEGMRFEGKADVFDNGKKHKQNSCYCPNNECQLKSGVRNATQCLLAPAFISYPHFYEADEYYVNAIEGMHPNEKNHKFYVTLQKDSGLPLELFIRLQINILLEPHDFLDLFKDVPRIFFPGIWFEGTINMPTTIEQKLQFSFVTIPRTLVGVGLIFVMVGVVLLVCEIAITRKNKLSARITQA